MSVDGMRERKSCFEAGDLRSRAIEDLSVVRRSEEGVEGRSTRMTEAPLLARRRPQKGPGEYALVGVFTVAGGIGRGV